jgi:hypothetical protein
MKMPTKEELEYLRSEYPSGTRVELLQMDDPYPVPVGTKGRVMHIDDAGTAHVQWSNGSTLGVVSEDEFRIIGDE